VARAWLLTLVLAATPAGAVDLPPVVVSATPGSQPAPREDVTAAATVILPQEQRDRQRTVTDLLDESVGATVRRFGGVGSFATLSLRGSGASQVAVFLDGVPLNRADNGAVDLSTLPLAALSRIEIYRGASPVGLGGQGIGGVVNLVTLAPDEPRTTVSAGVGSFGTVDGAVTRSQRLGRIDLLAHLQALHTDGDFPFDDDNGTPLNPDDDERVRRRNNRQDQGSLLLKAAGPLGTGRWQLSTLTFARTTGVPGIGALQSREARLAQLREVASVTLSAPRLGPVEGAEARLFGQVERLDFEDKEGEIGLGRQDNRDTTVAYGLTLRGERRLGDHHRATLLLQGEQERYTATNHLASPPDAAPQERRLATAAVEDRITLWDERLEIAPLLRYERYRYDFSGDVTFAGTPQAIGARDGVGHLTGKIGARLDLDGGLSLRASAGRHVREPTFGELFGDRGGVVGNPDLTAERGTTWDAGAEWSGDLGPIAAEVSYTYFDLRLDDLIQLVQTGQHVAVAHNIAAARIRGHEVAVDLRHGRLHLAGNWTHLESEDRSDDAFARGHDLPGRPRDEVFVRVAREGERIAPFYELHHVSGNHLDRAALVEVDARTLHDVGVRVRPAAAHDLTLSFEIANLTDDATTDIAGFPLPGRTLRCGAAWTF
jgi:outer membrane cobalamin receptor